jgi:hypothetical protein
MAVNFPAPALCAARRLLPSTRTSPVKDSRPVPSRILTFVITWLAMAPPAPDRIANGSEAQAGATTVVSRELPTKLGEPP